MRSAQAQLDALMSTHSPPPEPVAAQVGRGQLLLPPQLEASFVPESGSGSGCVSPPYITLRPASAAELLSVLLRCCFPLVVTQAAVWAALLGPLRGAAPPGAGSRVAPNLYQAYSSVLHALATHDMLRAGPPPAGCPPATAACPGRLVPLVLCVQLLPFLVRAYR